MRCGKQRPEKRVFPITVQWKTLNLMRKKTRNWQNHLNSKERKRMAQKSINRSIKGSGSIRMRRRGVWEARYTIGVDPGTKKQIQRSIYGKSRDEVRKRLNRIHSELDTGIYVDPVTLTVSEWANVWLNEYNNGVKETTNGCNDKARK